MFDDKINFLFSQPVPKQLIINYFFTFYVVVI